MADHSGRKYQDRYFSVLMNRRSLCFRPDWVSGTPQQHFTRCLITPVVIVYFCRSLLCPGEYYDLLSDKLNCYAGPLTGGSKVLLSGDVTPEQCFALGYACLAAAGTILAYALPRRCWLIGTVLLFIAHQYSGPPFKCNHRGLGELSASVATNVLLPQLAVLVQSASFEVSSPLLFHRILAVLVVPAFFLKVGLFLALNMADRRPDWLGGKYTLPVLLGEETAARCACNPMHREWCYY